MTESSFITDLQCLNWASHDNDFDYRNLWLIEIPPPFYASEAAPFPFPMLCILSIHPATENELPYKSSAY